MSISKHFLLPSDPKLVKAAAEIPTDQIHSRGVKKAIKQMLIVAFAEQKDRSKPVLVGLAAPQIGISKRIILVDIGADGHGGVSNLQIFINPQIVKYSPDQTEWYEGCYSTDQVCGIVSRPVKIKISAYDQNGQKLEKEYSGYTARIFQHEIDHLNGQEFVTHITDDSKLHWVEEDQFPQYRDNEAWRNWPHKCSRAKWNQIKGLLTG